MGCGAGANGILASRVTDHVVAVDVNPHAVAATSRNAERNGVAVHCIESDVFEAVDGRFDVIVIDPPFRWFTPRDPLERAITDENYESLGRFFAGAGRYLRPNGYVLLFFGTSGDVDHLDHLITTAGMTSQVVAERTINTRGQDTTYFVRRITTG